MTRDKHFKTHVRARMQATGETYTAARTGLMITAPPANPLAVEAERQQQLVVDRWFTAGRLESVPARRKVRAAVLLEVLTRFVHGRTYPERDVSRLLEAVHPDFAYLRRELVAFGYLDRDDGVYQVCRRAPVRSEQQRRELPGWEEFWLPGFVAASGVQLSASVAS